MIYIGIDPSSRKYGCAMCIINTTEKTATFKRFENALEIVVELNRIAEAVVCIEDSSKINATYRKSRAANIQDRMARNAGMNQAISKNLVSLCEKWYGSEKVFAISPNQKGMVIKDAALFERMAKAEGLTVVKSKKLLEDDFVAFHMARIGQQQYTLTQRAWQR